jgi:molybdopterin-guanine dinucleotide biosynthesis protein B
LTEGSNANKIIKLTIPLNKMKIIAFVGKSDTGKTRLITRLIAEWKRRERTVSVIKHCSHGFTLDLEGKDTWHFMEAGADNVSMVSPDKIATINKTSTEPDFLEIAATVFPDSDIVIVEGGHMAQNIKKIEVLRGAISGTVKTPKEELLAVVSDENLDLDISVFKPDQIGELVDFIEKKV